MEPNLVTHYDIDGLKISPPVKNGKYFISKVKSGKKPVLAQFPKMSIVKGVLESQQNFELEWSSTDGGYTKDVFEWCQKLNDLSLSREMLLKICIRISFVYQKTARVVIG